MEAVTFSLGSLITFNLYNHFYKLKHTQSLWLYFFFFICSEFCHTLKWNSHGFTCVPPPDHHSHLPLHPLPLGLPSAPGPSVCLMHPTWAGSDRLISAIVRVFFFFFVLYVYTTWNGAYDVVHVEYLSCQEECHWYFLFVSFVSPLISFHSSYIT